MESGKKNEMYISAVAVITVIFTSIYFYRRIEKIETKLAEAISSIGELAEQVANISNDVTVPQLRGEINKVKRDIMEVNQKLERCSESIKSLKSGNNEFKSKSPPDEIKTNEINIDELINEVTNS